MTHYNILYQTFSLLGINFSTQESMEFITGGMRRILWIYIETPDGEIDFKFNTYGEYEGLGIRNREDINV